MRCAGALLALGGAWGAVEVVRLLSFHGVTVAGMAGVLVVVHVLVAGLVLLFLPDMARRYAEGRARVFRETSCLPPSYERPLAIVAPLAITWNVWMAFLAYAVPLKDLLSDAPPGVSSLFRFVFPAVGVPLLIVLTYELVQRYHFRGWRLRLPRTEGRADEWISFELLLPPRYASGGGPDTTLLLVSREEMWSVGGGYWHGYGRPRPFPGKLEAISGPSGAVINGRLRIPTAVLEQYESVPYTRLWLFLCAHQGRWLKCLFELPLDQAGCRSSGDSHLTDNRP